MAFYHNLDQQFIYRHLHLHVIYSLWTHFHASLLVDLLTFLMIEVVPSAHFAKLDINTMMPLK